MLGTRKQARDALLVVRCFAALRPFPQYVHVRGDRRSFWLLTHGDRSLSREDVLVRDVRLQQVAEHWKMRRQRPLPALHLENFRQCLGFFRLHLEVS